MVSRTHWKLEVFFAKNTRSPEEKFIGLRCLEGNARPRECNARLSDVDQSRPGTREECYQEECYQGNDDGSLQTLILIQSLTEEADTVSRASR